MRPSDFHQHYRWGALFDAVAPENMRHNYYALAMPNQGPGDGNIIRTIGDGNRVYHRIMDARARHGIKTFREPIITIYLTKDVTPEVIEAVARTGFVRAVKSYPVHRQTQEGTTNSGLGVPFDECPETIRAMEESGVPLLIHAEDVNDKNGRELPHSEREGHCVRERLWKFRDAYPRLRICVEHASTVAAVEFVNADVGGNTVMTLTPQHLLFTENDMQRFSWRNHLRCMPYVKTPADREAVREFATSGDFRCIAGSDTAPHLSAAKNKPFEEAACGCFTPHAIALYALAFIGRGRMDERFAKFMSLNGPRWWNLPEPAIDDRIAIHAQTAHDIPDPTPVPGMNDVVIPLGWTMENDRLKVGLVAQ